MRGPSFPERAGYTGTYSSRYEATLVLEPPATPTPIALWISHHYDGVIEVMHKTGNVWSSGTPRELPPAVVEWLLEELRPRSPAAEPTLDDLAAQGRCSECGTLGGIWHKLGCPNDGQRGGRPGSAPENVQPGKPE